MSGVFSGVHLLDVKLVSVVFTCLMLSGVHFWMLYVQSVSGVFHGVHLLDAVTFSVECSVGFTCCVEDGSRGKKEPFALA